MYDELMINTVPYDEFMIFVFVLFNILTSNFKHVYEQCEYYF